MGGRAGGGAAGGMGRASRGGANPNVVFRGGWNGSDKDTAYIVINAINKETEKAINVKTLVDWAKGRAHEKDIWVPKSTIRKIEKSDSNPKNMWLEMKKSMAQSIATKNNYKGYDMEFTNSINVWGP